VDQLLPQALPLISATLHSAIRTVGTIIITIGIAGTMPARPITIVPIIATIITVGATMTVATTVTTGIIKNYQSLEEPGTPPGSFVMYAPDAAGRGAQAE